MAWRILSQDEARARRGPIEGLAGNNALAEEDAASTTDPIAPWAEQSLVSSPGSFMGQGSRHRLANLR